MSPALERRAQADANLDHKILDASRRCLARAERMAGRLVAGPWAEAWDRLMDTHDALMGWER